MQDSTFIGLDVHKATISVAIARGARGAGLGEAPGLQRVDLRKRKLARERRFKAAVIRPGRFEHDAGNWRLAEPFY